MVLVEFKSETGGLCEILEVPGVASGILKIDKTRQKTTFCVKVNLSGRPESDFNEFEPRLKSAKNRFQLRANLNLETLNTILSGTNHIWAASQI